MTRQTTATITFFIIWVGLAVSTIVEPARNWALTFGAYLPQSTATTWLGLTLVVGLAAAYIKLPKPSEPTAPSGRDLTFGLVTGVVMTGLMILFRTKFHFLGDGYALLDTYSSAYPHIKTREIGEAMLHYWLTNASGGGEDGALMSFRILSILSGALLLIGSAVWARRLPSRPQYWLFLAGVATGGQMLLYFGYVEQYSIFNLALAAFLFTGIAVAQETISRWWILVPLAAAFILHSLAVVVVIPTIYLLVGPKNWRRWRHRFTPAQRKAGLVLLIAVILIGYWLFTTQRSFVSLAFLPLLPNRFTFDNFWLFSPRHLIDFANLLLLLAPALFILLPTVWTNRRGITQVLPAAPFLVISMVTAVLMMFVIDPKPGMPRDIDLLSFGGTILTIGVWYLFVRISPPSIATLRIGLIAIILSATLLSGRIMVMQTEAPAVAQLKHYLSLYFSRSRTGYAQLARLYRVQERQAENLALRDEWNGRFKAPGLVDRAELLYTEQKYAEALPLLKQAIEIDPMYADPYFIMGTCLIQLNRHAQAEEPLRIGLSLNPDYISAWNSLGVVAMNAGRNEEAIDYLKRSLAPDTLYGYGEYNIAAAYYALHDSANYRKHLRRAVEDPNMEARVYGLQLQAWLSERKIDSCRWLYDTRLRNQLTEEQRIDLEKKVPALAGGLSN